jgi:heptosyltransferase-3
MTQVDRPKGVLIICMRRIGDVLLTTPLARSFLQAWPGVKIHWLVHKGTEGVLEANPVASKIITISPAARLTEVCILSTKIFQGYDIAVSTQSGDRPSFFARLAGHKAVTFRSKAKGGRLRGALFSSTVEYMPVHRVQQVLSLLKPFAVDAEHQLSIPVADFSYVEQKLPKAYVVFHPGAAFRYKQWTKDGWVTLVKKFRLFGYVVVVTGSGNKVETSYLNDLFRNSDVTRADGSLTWPQLVGLLKRASYFVGVDTSITHLAAACGAKGIAIFGPTNPDLWGPARFSGHQLLQVVQNKNQQCVPCQNEGCESHVLSYSRCLDTLSPEVVWSQVECTLAFKPQKVPIYGESQR